MNLHEMTDQAFGSMHIKIEAIAPATSYWTNGIGFAFGALTFNQWIMAITVLLGIATFLVNTYFQRLRNRREAEYHKRRMEIQDAIKEAGK